MRIIISVPIQARETAKRIRSYGIPIRISMLLLVAVECINRSVVPTKDTLYDEGMLDTSTYSDELLGQVIVIVESLIRAIERKLLGSNVCGDINNVYIHGHSIIGEINGDISAHSEPRD